MVAGGSVARKWTPATIASVVRTRSRPGGGRRLRCARSGEGGRNEQRRERGGHEMAHVELPWAVPEQEARGVQNPTSVANRDRFRRRAGRDRPFVPTPPPKGMLHTAPESPVTTPLAG